MPEYFNLDSYYSRLKTKSLGRPCIYLDQVDSTIDVACEQKPDTIVLAKEQLKGRGQRSNTWQSPFGCAMASIRFSCRKVYYISKRLCFLQHLLALSAARTLEKIDSRKLGKQAIKLKWPNDIIYKPEGARQGLKIGGVLVNTKDMNDEYDITLSFGLNVFNREPTTCITAILGYNDNGTDKDIETGVETSTTTSTITATETATRKQITIDSVVADILNHLEGFVYDLDEERFQELKRDYVDRCLHMNRIVEDENHGRVLVRELNDDGYLVGERCVDQKLCTITRISSYDC